MLHSSGTIALHTVSTICCSLCLLARDRLCLPCLLSQQCLKARITSGMERYQGLQTLESNTNRNKTSDTIQIIGKYLNFVSFSPSTQLGKTLAMTAYIPFQKWSHHIMSFPNCMNVLGYVNFRVRHPMLILTSRGHHKPQMIMSRASYHCHFCVNGWANYNLQSHGLHSLQTAFNCHSYWLAGAS